MNNTFRSYFPVLFIILGTAIGFTGASLRPDPTKTELNSYQIAQKQTVLVVAGDGQGSAVVIKRTNPHGNTRWFAWTAAHVVDGHSEVKIKVILRTEGRKVGETVYTARVLGASREMDCALLFIDAAPDAFVPAIFAPNTPALPGDPIFACGNYRGAQFEGSVSTGIIAQIGVQPALSGWPWEICDQTTAPAYPGSSGGPVFDRHGRVLGLTVGGLNATLNVFVPVRAIAQWATERGFLWAVRGEWCPAAKDLRPVVIPKPKPAIASEGGCHQ